jgi:Zn-dependent protease
MIMGIGVTTAFLFHELAHKVVAQYYHLWSEFRIEPFMGTLSLITAIPWIPIKIIAPGTVQIFGYPNTLEQMGKISIAGSLVNLVQVAVFTSLSLFIHELILIALLNAELAVFNLMPVSILDGRKVFAWNKIVWALAFTAAIVSRFFILFV